jgi:hypothetical protein
MNISTSMPFGTKSAPLAQSMDSELAPEESASKPDMPPYFSWSTKWQVSAAELWGSFFKSLLSF